MPIIKVYGVPDTMNEALGSRVSPETYQCVLGELCDSIRFGVASLPDLALTANDVTVFFPTDRLQIGLGEEIIVEVTGLYEKPGRDEIVRRSLAELLARVVAGRLGWRLPQLKMVEVLISTFNPQSGFARWDRPKEKTR